MGDLSFVSSATRARIRGAVVPIALGAGRLGLTPNALTVIGFLISGAAALVAWQQAWLGAAALVIFGGSFDMLDGGLALAGLDGGIAPGARGQSWLGIGLSIIFVTASITAVQRTWHVRSQLRSEEQRDK